MIPLYLCKATAYIFTDMQTPDRHGHAMECYTVTWKRCGALLHWVTQVRFNCKQAIENRGAQIFMVAPVIEMYIYL